MPSPFALPPHALARRAADELRAYVATRDFALAAPGGGKMFGVLVVRAPDGRIGYLRAFSGMLGGSWLVDGFVPPAFDLAGRAAFWPAGEAELAAIDRELTAVLDETMPLAEEHAAILARQRTEAADLHAIHAGNRRDRHAARATADPAAAHVLDQASRGDAADRKRLVARHRGERDAIEARLHFLDDRRGTLEQRRSERSRALLVQIQDTYAFAGRSLRALFAPAEPPGGAGDCAAPKLLVTAARAGLQPLALAELWIGGAPATGGRHDGVLYPACRGKCGPILAHLLAGIAEPPPVIGIAVAPADQPRAVFDDAWIAVVDKPPGLLSVPGRHEQLRDSVLVRLQRRYPEAEGPLLVHRLDLDASGLLLAAKDRATHAALQELFARRAIDKRYIAWLDGIVEGDSGTIELSLRSDIDDRPRQVIDAVHGKAALTEWRVVERTATRTRVMLRPRTGRTHQLRVHCAHGLAAPIVGDRLYGHGSDDRLLLHAETLAFVHPATGERIELTSPAPF
ncbi:MAG: RluA family pseudouridine synthase [Kofleriaceae bacterium]